MKSLTSGVSVSQRPIAVAHCFRPFVRLSTRAHFSNRAQHVSTRAVVQPMPHTPPRPTTGGVLEELLPVEAEDTVSSTETAPGQLRDGTYTGSADGGMRIDLRVDVFESSPAPFNGRKTLNVVSLDLFRGSTYLATMKNHGSSEFININRNGINGWVRKFNLTRTEPGTNWQEWYNIVFNSSSNQLTLSGEDGDWTFTMRYDSPHFRKLDLEIDWGVNFPDGPKFIAEYGPEMVKFYQKAGVDLRVNEGRSRSNAVRANDEKWDRNELHRALVENFDTPLEHRAWPQWSLYGLVVPSYWSLRENRERRTVRGVMWDSSIAPYRQGWAVFSDAMLQQGWPPRSDQEWRSILRTLMHEAGHALNLSHSFKKDRIWALSWMNYDSRYGWDKPFKPSPQEARRNRQAYWKDFNRVGWDFDRPELEVIRHGDLTWVAPGGQPFDGDGPHFTHIDEDVEVSEP